MKLVKCVIFTMLLTSCVTPRYTYKEPERRGYGIKTTSEKIQDCVYRLVEVSGISAKEAQESCVKIHRR